uniref:CA domain-containing protein n=1 Tax=Haemonchus placei TaxID=6290 RepID=A0A0N4WZ58_HAEPC
LRPSSAECKLASAPTRPSQSSPVRLDFFGPATNDSPHTGSEGGFAPRLFQRAHSRCTGSLWHRQDPHKLPYCRLNIRYPIHHRHCHDVCERRGNPVHGHVALSGRLSHLRVVRHISASAAADNRTPTDADLSKILKTLGNAFYNQLDFDERVIRADFRDHRQLLEDSLP